MSNPKDWFRRRRVGGSGDTSRDPADPFADDTVLELGESAILLRASVAGADDRRLMLSPEVGSVPPPLRPAGSHRAGRVIDRSAFAIRPEIRRRDAAAAPPPFAAPEPAQRAPALAKPVPANRERHEMPVAPPRPDRAAAPPAAPTPVSPTPEPHARRASDETNPTFMLAAPGTSWRLAHTSSAEAISPNALLRDAFTPTRPKRSTDLFSGRAKQLQRIIAAIEEERAHVVVYGERGSGKTSLANVLAEKAEAAGYLVLRFACSSHLSFEDLFRGFLRRLPASLLADGLGSGNRAGVENFEELLPGPGFGIAELVAIFERIHDRHVILIVDEYDRMTSDDAKNELAELIKIMSDNSVPVTLLLIGVADDVRDLFGKHPSLQRTLVTIPMPLMARSEIDGIIAAGEAKSGVRFDPEVRRQIADFAQGLPYHAQLLCLFSVRSTLRRHSTTVERQDLRYAVERAAEEAESRIKEAYNLAVGSHEQTSFHDVLFLAARCRTDEFGTFTAADVAAAGRHGTEEMSLLSLQYPLKKLTDPERGMVLRRIVGPSGLRYQFCSQMMRHYVLVRQAVQRGIV